MWDDYLLFVWAKGFTLLLRSEHMGIYHAGECVCVCMRGKGGGGGVVSFPDRIFYTCRKNRSDELPIPFSFKLVYC